MDPVDDFLEHYGTRGMKWGVRKNIQRRSGDARSSYVDAKDADWVSKVDANPKISKVARIAARDAKRQTKRLKKDYKDRGLNVKKNGLDRTRYDSELKSILQQSVDRASNKVHGTSPTGLKEVQIHRYADGSMSATIGTRDNSKIRSQQRKIAKADRKEAKRIKHADTDVPVAEDFDGLEFLFVLDNDGFVDDILTPFDDEGDEDLEQSDDDEELLHYGTKGMKWGVRKASSPRPAFMPPVKSSSGKPKWQSAPEKKSPAAAPTAPKSRFGKKAKTPRVLSEEAAQFRDIRLKAKREGVQSLSNKDLELVNKRIELQSKYNKAFPKKKNPFVEVAIEGILSDYGSKKVVDMVKNKNPAMGMVVEAAIVLNKNTRSTKK